MQGATVAVVLLGLLAVVSAGDVSEPKHLTGRLSCVLPIEKMRCVRDWRSGFVAGISYGYDVKSKSDVFTQVCSNVINNQTRYEMWNLRTAGSGAGQSNAGIKAAQRDAPAWYGPPLTTDADLTLPLGALITQVLVLHAPNPWGDKFGTIPAVAFGYLDNTDNFKLKWATCGNPLYTKAFLEPETNPAPPTPVTLKASYSSGLSEENDKLTVLGGFDGKCATRGTQFVAYHGGDPWKSSKFFLKQLTKPCFIEYDLINQLAPAPPAASPPNRVDTIQCTNNDVCKAKCFYDKKNNKKGPSYSCATSGLVIAVGKHGPIHFDNHGDEWEYAPDAQGKLQMVKAKAGEAVIEGEAMPEDAEEP